MTALASRAGRHRGAPPAAHSPAGFAWSEAQAGARTFSRTSDPIRLLGDALALADAGIVVLSSAGAYLLRHGPASVPLEITSTTLLATALTFNVMRLGGAYTRDATAPVGVQVRRAAQGWSLVFVALVIVGYLTKTSDTFSRLWAVGWYGSALVGFAVARVAAASRIRRWRVIGKLARTVAVVDLSGTGDDLARRMVRGAAGELRLVGVFSPERAAGRKNGLDDLVALSPPIPD